MNKAVPAGPLQTFYLTNSSYSFYPCSELECKSNLVSYIFICIHVCIHIYTDMYTHSYFFLKTANNFAVFCSHSQSSPFLTTGNSGTALVGRQKAL